MGYLFDPDNWEWLFSGNNFWFLLRGFWINIQIAFVAMVLSLIGAIVAEVVGAQRGLGMLITSMNFTMDVSGQFSVLLLLSLLGLALNAIIVAIRKRVLFWDPSQKTTADAPAKGGLV